MVTSGLTSIVAVVLDAGSSHIYEVPPEATNVILPPIHIVVSIPANAIGLGLTITSKLTSLVQPYSLVSIPV